MTADKVIENYLTALGGEEKLKQLKDIKMVMTASIQGNDIEIVQTNKLPGKMLREVKMGSMVMQKEIYNGNKAAMYQQGQKMPDNGVNPEDYVFESALVPELEYKNSNVKTELKGLENIDGEDVYVVEVTLPSGEKSSHYFNTETGLKMKEVSSMKTPQGEMTQSILISEYLEKSGVKFPGKITLSPPGLVAEVISIEVNKGVEDTLFDVQ